MTRPDIVQIDAVSLDRRAEGINVASKSVRLESDARTIVRIDHIADDLVEGVKTLLGKRLANQPRERVEEICTQVVKDALNTVEPKEELHVDAASVSDELTGEPNETVTATFRKPAEEGFDRGFVRATVTGLNATALQYFTDAIEFEIIDSETQLRELLVRCIPTSTYIKPPEDI